MLITIVYQLVKVKITFKIGGKQQQEKMFGFDRGASGRVFIDVDLCRIGNKTTAHRPSRLTWPSSSLSSFLFSFSRSFLLPYSCFCLFEMRWMKKKEEKNFISPTEDEDRDARAIRKRGILRNNRLRGPATSGFRLDTRLPPFPPR